MKFFNILRYTVLILTFLDITGISGYIIPTAYKNGGAQGVAKKQALKLRNNYNNLLCNEKFIYMKYLIGIRNFKKLYRIIKDNSNIDIQNIINIINYINTTQIANINENNYNNSIFVNNSLFLNTTLFINNTDINNNNEKIAKNLVLSNVYIDVSNVKYIQISTKNDTLIVELDKNNADTASPNNIHNLIYDISNIETLISSMSLLLKVLNIN
jgi:hypothetical protein